MGELGVELELAILRWIRALCDAKELVDLAWNQAGPEEHISVSQVSLYFNVLVKACNSAFPILINFLFNESASDSFAME
jgi:hypothetical protein